MYRVFCCIASFILLFSACSPDRQKELKAPANAEEISKSADFASPGNTAMLEITPSDGARNTAFSLIAKNFNISDARIEWLINGTPAQGATGFHFKPSESNKGDRVQAKAIVQGMEILSNTIQLKNAIPELSSIKIMPDVLRPGDTLYVDVSATDADGDTVKILYEWTKNGEPAGKSNRIEGPIKRGDKIVIKITPFDGEEYGQTAVLRREIGNMPPVIIEDRAYNFYGRTYTYQVKAEDPDGDTLTYSIKSGPQGMIINSTTGLIRWNVPSDFKGKTSLTFSVSDGHGGEATQSFTIDIPS